MFKAAPSNREFLSWNLLYKASSIHTVISIVLHPAHVHSTGDEINDYPSNYS